MYLLTTKYSASVSRLIFLPSILLSTLVVCLAALSWNTSHVAGWMTSSVFGVSFRGGNWEPATLWRLPLTTKIPRVTEWPTRSGRYTAALLWLRSKRQGRHAAGVECLGNKDCRNVRQAFRWLVAVGFLESQDYRGTEIMCWQRCRHFLTN